MWEIYTEGKLPFEGENWATNDDFAQLLIRGVRPKEQHLLKLCEIHHRHLMKTCWQTKASNRPTFKNIRKEVENFAIIL